MNCRTKPNFDSSCPLSGVKRTWRFQSVMLGHSRWRHANRCRSGNNGINGHDLGARTQPCGFKTRGPARFQAERGLIWEITFVLKLGERAGGNADIAAAKAIKANWLGPLRRPALRVDDPAANSGNLQKHDAMMGRIGMIDVVRIVSRG